VHQLVPAKSLRLSRRSKPSETVEEGDDGEHESDWNSEADAGPSSAFICSQPDSKKQAAKKHPSSDAQQGGEYGSDARNNHCNDYPKDFVAIQQLSSLPWDFVPSQTLRRFFLLSNRRLASRSMSG
jgi:hypothetical protein